MRRALIGLLCLLALQAAIAQPSLIVRPEAIPFGPIPVGTIAVSYTYIVNIGNEDLIGSAEVTGEGFALIGLSDFVLQPRDSGFVFQVQFTPLALQSYTGELTVTSNDPVQPVIAVPLTGQGVEEPPPPVEFHLLAPEDRSFVDFPITFEWEALDLPGETTYILKILADSSDPARPIWEFPAGMATSYVVYENDVPAAEFYAWWVEAENEGIIFGSSEVWTVYTGDPPPPPPHFGLITPEDGVTITTQEITFEWEALGNDPTTEYQLWIVARDSVVGQPPEQSFDVGTATQFVLDATLLLDDLNYWWYVVAGDVYSDEQWMFTLNLDGYPPLDVEPIEALAAGEFQIKSVYPNPFNPRTEIRLSVAIAGNVRAEIFDILGRTVATLTDGFLGNGTHTLIWKADAPAGTYLLKVSHESGETQIRRLLLLK